MNVCIVSELRLKQLPDGSAWISGSGEYRFWRRYLDVFDTVHIAARCEYVTEVPDSSWRPVTGESVGVCPVPFYIGPLAFARKYTSVRKAIRHIATGRCAHILRAPSVLAALATPQLANRRQPFGLEVVGDPYDVFAPETFQHPMRPLLRWHGQRTLSTQCRQATATAYVTRESLQRRYPPDPRAFTTHYSSIDLPNEALVAVPRQFTQPLVSPRLVFVGSFAQLYKAPDVLVQAVRLCAQAGLDIHLTFIGDGKYRPEIEAQVREAGLQGRVTFTGSLPSGSAVREHLDASDMFVLPSRTEGLPRAMIEAMARGLPCIGSTAGGIPELLPAEDMVPPGDAYALALKIRKVAADPERMSRMANHNLRVAQDYREEILRNRRNEFYRTVREQTEAWLRKTSQ